LGSSGSEQQQVTAGSCECCNELSGTIKRGQFQEQLRKY